MQTKLNLTQSLKAGLIAAAVGAVGNVILFYVFRAAGIMTDDILVPDQPLDAIHVVFSSVVGVVIGSLVFYLLEKYTNNGFRIFIIVSIVLLILLGISPFTMVPGMTIGYGIVLNLMHFVSAGALYYFLKAAIATAQK